MALSMLQIGMGIDIDYFMATGFTIMTDEIDRILKRHVVGHKSHFEDRFDPKTGEQIESEEICDDEGDLAFTVNGEEIVVDIDNDIHYYIDLLKMIVGEIPNIEYHEEMSNYSDNTAVLIYAGEECEWGHRNSGKFNIELPSEAFIASLELAQKKFIDAGFTNLGIRVHCIQSVH